MRSLLSRWASRLASSSVPLSAKPTDNSNLKKDDSMASTSSGLTLLQPSPRACLPNVAHLPETKRLVAEVAIKTLFTKRWFDICQLDSLISITGAQHGSPAYRLLRPLHCMDWADMSPDLRERVPLLVREALQTNQWATEAADTVMSVLEPQA